LGNQNLAMIAPWVQYGAILVKDRALARNSSAGLRDLLAHEEAHFVLGARTWFGNQTAGHQEVYSIGRRCSR
jgi:hypothetical protein